MYFSIIIPVYNRPDELDELLQSLCLQDFQEPFEVVVVEDGSSIPSQDVVAQYNDRLRILYLTKKNTGPGDSRNYGMLAASGDYYLIFDSDCIIPPQYLSTVSQSLKLFPVDCFGGPDADRPEFSNIQRAINVVMTSAITTGGIRGGSEMAGRFQPRSFNMGLSKKAFDITGGFGQIHPGEDPDLSLRLWKKGFSTRLIPEAFVYHKRRISWHKFFTQVQKFGKARPILDSWHPGFRKITYFFPLFFMVGLVFALILAFMNWPYLLWAYAGYMGLVFLSALVSTRSLLIALLSCWALLMQFSGYAWGFLQSFVKIRLLNKEPEHAFPELFFKT